MNKYITSPKIKNTEPLYNLTRSNPKSRLKWVWFPVLKVGSTAIRGMINRHLRPEWKENGKDDSYNPVSYVDVLLRNEGIKFTAKNPKSDAYKCDDWSVDTPACVTPIPFPDDDIDQFVKFAFVRNPWSRLLSCWCDTRYTNKNISSEIVEQTPFRDFVIGLRNQNMWVHTNKHMQMQQAAFLNVQMNFIGKLENAHDDFAEICKMLEQPRPEVMLQKNKTEHNHYSEYYDDETREIVADIYKDDIERFDYTFETV